VSERKAEGLVSSVMIWGVVCLPFESLAGIVAIVGDMRYAGLTVPYGDVGLDLR